MNATIFKIKYSNFKLPVHHNALYKMKNVSLYLVIRIGNFYMRQLPLKDRRRFLTSENLISISNHTPYFKQLSGHP